MEQLASPKRKTSVTKDDYSSSTLNFFIPNYSGWGDNIPQLPQQLPAYNPSAFNSRRNIVSMSTVKLEPMWANAVAVAVTKATAWGWEVEGAVPLRRKRAQAFFMNATAGIFRGFVPFLQAHLSSYAMCGYAVVELEREKRPYGSRLRAPHHLNPLRCRLTDDPETPVLYLDRAGKVHELKYWQVAVIPDMADPTLGDFGMVQSAVARVYLTILTMSVIERYVYEKVSGNRPLSLEFIQGLTATSLDDAIKSAKMEQSNKGAVAYKGVAVVPIASDTPITRVSIPLAEIPDGFNAKEITDNTTVKYANALGLDVNDLDPRLAARQALGSGAQSIVLNEKAKGRGFAGWKTQWVSAVNYWALDTATRFYFVEPSLDDELKKAQKQQVEIGNITTMVDKQLIDATQAKNLAVDADLLPREFIDKDVTGGGTLGDDEKPTEDGEGGTAVAQDRDAAEEETTKETRQQQARRLLNKEIENGVAVAEAARPDVELVKKKHLAGKHDQSSHGKGGGVHRSVTDYEKKNFSGRRLERAAVFDDNGQLMLEIDGSVDRVQWGADDLRVAYGRTVTHNHPSDSTLSDMDVRFMIRNNIKEMRAVGSNSGVVYRMKYEQSKNRAPTSFGGVEIPFRSGRQLDTDYFERLYTKHNKAVSKQMWLDIADGKTTQARALKTHNHRIWQLVAEEMDGLEYIVEGDI